MAAEAGARATRRAAHAVALVAASLVGGGLVVALLDSRDGRAVASLTDASGYVCLAFLLWSLGIGPWRVLRRRPNPMSQDLRRDVGLAAGATGAVHIVASFGVHLVELPLARRAIEYVDLRGHDPKFAIANLLGVGASALLLLLSAISSDRAMRMLRRNRWKQVQQTNYLLTPLAVLHAAIYWLIRSRPGAVVALASAATVVVVGLQVAGFRRRRAPEVQSASVTATDR